MTLPQTNDQYMATVTATGEKVFRTDLIRRYLSQDNALTTQQLMDKAKADTGEDFAYGSVASVRQMYRIANGLHTPTPRIKTYAKPGKKAKPQVIPAVAKVQPSPTNNHPTATQQRAFRDAVVQLRQAADVLGHETAKTILDL